MHPDRGYCTTGFLGGSKSEPLFATLDISSASNALPNSWRRTWSANGAGGFPCPTLRKVEEAAIPERDVSTPARRANQLADRTMKQYNAAQQLSSSRSFSEAESEHVKPQIVSVELLKSHRERAEAFKNDALAVDNLIMNLTSNLRLDGATGAKAKELERLKKEAEEARRRQAAEERAARAQEAAARDPHKKVNLKIENTKKFGMAFIEELSIPMQQVDFHDDNGIQQVSMVDVLQIRQRCKRCDTTATPSVESLIADQSRSDRMQGRDPKTGRRKPPKDGSSGSLPAGPSKSGSPTDSHPESPVEGKRARINPESKLSQTGQATIEKGPRKKTDLTLTKRKEARMKTQQSHAHMQNMLKKLNTMRSAPPEATLYNLEQIANQAQRDLAYERTLAKEEAHISFKASRSRTATFRTMDSRLSIETTRARTGSATEGEMEQDPTPRAIIRGTRRVMSEKSVGSGTVVARRSIKSLRENCDPKVHERAMEATRIFRYAVSVHVLAGICRKKRKAIAIASTVIEAIGEWARVRQMMTRLTNNVKILQRAARQFLALKRKRCDLMSKEWQRVEDSHLEVHMNKLAKKTIQDEKNKAVEAKAGPEGSIKQKMAMQKNNANKDSKLIEKMMLNNVHWIQYRIPSQDRKAVLSRFYMVHMKKKIVQTQNLIAVVHDIVQMHKDTLGFLKEFGASETQGNDLKPMATRIDGHRERPSEFWVLSEDTALDLIAFAAQRMPKTDPWRDHPANREISGMDNPMYRPRLKAHKSGKAHDILGMMGEKRPGPVEDKRATLRKSTVHITALSIADDGEELSKDDKPADIGDLWDSFTPRLRENVADSNRPISRMSDRPSSRPGLGEQDQAAWRLAEKTL